MAVFPSFVKLSVYLEILHLVTSILIVPITIQAICFVGMRPHRLPETI